MPAEWEHHDAILMSMPNPDTDWAEIIDEVTECYLNIIAKISSRERLLLIAPDGFDALPVNSNIEILNIPYNDTWTRDYGPLTVETAEGAILHLDFGFNGWGLKFASDRDNLVTSRITDRIGLKRENHLGFILEGGSIESDGRGTILTTSTCLLSPNRNGDLNRIEIEEYLASALGAKRVLWLECDPLEGDDTDAHIDTIARLAPDDTIIYVGCDDPCNPNFSSLRKLESQLKEFRTTDGKPYRLLRLPSPAPMNGNPATYANFLIMPDLVLVPTYGQPDTDAAAMRIIAEAFPGRDVEAVDCQALIKQHGSLHCATMQIRFQK